MSSDVTRADGRTVNSSPLGAPAPSSAARGEFVVTQRLNVYERPSSSGQRVKYPKGTRLVVVGETTDELGYRWWRVTLLDGRPGFVFDTTEGYFSAALTAPVPPPNTSPRVLARRKWLARVLVGLSAFFGVVYVLVPLAFGDYAARARNELFGLCVPISVLSLFGSVWLKQGDLPGPLSLTGRIGRSTFWLAMVPLNVLALVLTYLSLLPREQVYPYPPDLQGGGETFFLTLSLSVLAGFAIPVQVKRWHDLDHSGWTTLVNLIPLLGWVLSFGLLGFVRGTFGPNRFGADPLLSNHVDGKAALGATSAPEG